jgi:ParB family chromosome partitioning protein
MELREIPINKIKPNPLQPREHFDREKITELAESIKENGLVTPILVRPKGSDYEIIAGERRWKASQIAKLDRIPAIIKKIDDGKLITESLIENIHREDLTDIEKAKALKTLMKTTKIESVRDLAKVVGLSYTAVSDIFDSVDIRKELEASLKTVSQSVISETRGLPKEERKKLIETAVKKDIGSRKMREYVSAIKEAEKQPFIKKQLLGGRIEPEIAKQKITQLKQETSDDEVEIIKEWNIGKLKCPRCKKMIKIIHIEPTDEHKIEDI